MDATAPGDQPRSSPRGRAGRAPAWRPVVAGAVAVVAVVLWWWWPTVARNPDRLDVLVVGTGQIRDAEQAIARRTREEGMSIEIDLTDPCVDPARLGDDVVNRSPAVVVVSPRRPCGTWIEVVDAARRGGDRLVVVLAQTDTLTPTDRTVLTDLGVVIADPSRLLGAVTMTRQPCQWWDDCEIDGLVAVRQPDGRITEAGAQRIARVLVGNIP